MRRKRLRLSQTLRQPLEGAPCRRAITHGDTVKRRTDSRLDRASSGGIDPRAARREMQHGAPPIAWIIDALEQPMCDEPLKHPCQRAGMHVQDRREIACRQSRK